jgi:hypothetical protein
MTKSGGRIVKCRSCIVPSRPGLTLQEGVRAGRHNPQSHRCIAAQLSQIHLSQRRVEPGISYQTKVILLSTSGAINTTLSFFGDDGSPLAVGKNAKDNP